MIPVLPPFLPLLRGEHLDQLGVSGHSLNARQRSIPSVAPQFITTRTKCKLTYFTEYNQTIKEKILSDLKRHVSEVKGKVKGEGESITHPLDASQARMPAYPALL